MKTTLLANRAVIFAVGISLALPLAGLFAGDKQPVPGWDVPDGPVPEGARTELDIPGDFHKYYGQRRNQYNDSERKIAKIDLDADMNYDGIIDNDDPADNGAFQQTPPGLVIGEGEMTQLIIRCTPYRVDYRGAAVVTLEVAGINRGDVTGQFASFDEEVASTSQVRVWRDRARTILLLDSADPTRRFFEWTIDDASYPANVPSIIPRTVYIEGVSANGSYTGDMRVLLTVSHRNEGEGLRIGPADSEYKRAHRQLEIEYGANSGKSPVGKTIVEEPVEEPKRALFNRFRTSFDHILVTVAERPQQKEFIRNNSDGVWGRGGPPVSRK